MLTLASDLNNDYAKLDGSKPHSQKKNTNFEKKKISHWIERWNKGKEKKKNQKKPLNWTAQCDTEEKTRRRYLKLNWKLEIDEDGLNIENKNK